MLENKSIGLFICGMQGSDVMEAELNSNFPQGLLKIAVAKECLGGEFVFEKMNFMEKIIVKKVSKVTSNQTNILEDNIHKFVQAMNSI